MDLKNIGSDYVDWIYLSEQVTGMSCCKCYNAHSYTITARHSLTSQVTVSSQGNTLLCGTSFEV